MITLYYAPRTRAARVRWMLEELGIEYQLHRVDVANREQRSDAYRERLHPLGHVPVLTDGDFTLFESAAMVLYLADRFPAKGLAPPPGSLERGTYYQWVFCATTELEPHVWTHWLHTRLLPEERRIAGLPAAARAAVNANLAAFERGLSDGREYLLGAFSAADVVAGWIVNWAYLQGLVDSSPRVEAWSRRVAQRPAHVRSRAD